MRTMFGNLGNHFVMQRSLLELYTLELAIFPMSCSYGGMKESSMYMHCGGLYLRVFMWYDMLGRGVMLLWRVGGVVLGVVGHNFVSLICIL